MTIDERLAQLINLDADTRLREEARRLVRDFLETHPSARISPTQLHGLRQVASQQPSRVASFAKHQSDREQAKETDKAFWKLVHQIVSSSGQQPRWSLRKHAAEQAKAVFVDSEVQGSADPTKKQIDEVLHRYIPVFFSLFCVEFLYQQQLRANQSQKAKKGNKP